MATVEGLDKLVWCLMFMSKRERTVNRFGRLAIGLSMLSLIGKGLGFLREAIIAWGFGAGSVTDAFVAAVTLFAIAYAMPNNVATNAFMAPLVAALNRSEERGHHYFSTVVLLTLGVGSLMALLLIIFADHVVIWIAPGFGLETRDLTVSMVRWGAVSVPLTCLLTVFRVYLNATGNFSTPAYAALCFNAVAIVSLFILRKSGPLALMWTFVLALALQVCWHLPAIAKRGLTLAFDMSLSEVHDLLRMAKPIALSTIAFQVNAMIKNVLGSFLDSGSLSALRYANMIFLLPVGIYVTTLVQISFPRLSNTITLGHRRFADEVRLLWLSVLGGVLPIAVVLSTLSLPIVKLVYQRGAFSEADCVRTAVALAIYGMGLVAYSFRDVAQVVSFSTGDAKSPTRSTILMLVITAVTSFLLVKPLGYVGLAIGVTLGYYAGAIQLYWNLRDHFNSAHLWLDSMRYGIGGAVMVGVIMLLDSRSCQIRPVVDVTTKAGAGLVAYVLTCWVVRAPLVGDIIRRIYRKIADFV